MQKFMILGAALALGSVMTLPGLEMLNIGGEAHAMNGDRQNVGGRRGNGNRAGNRARNRTGNRAGRNGNRAGNRAGRNGRDAVNTTRAPAAPAATRPQRRTNAAPARSPRRLANTRRGERFEGRRFRDRRDFSRPARRHRAARFERGFRDHRACVRPQRIKRRLYRQGWDIESFARIGPRIQTRVRNRRGKRYVLILDRCDGHVVSEHKVKHRRRGLKKVFRKIRKFF